MSARSCRVTITDIEGAHTVEVTAGTLYEAVALGLAAIRGNEWVMGIAEGMNVVRVRVTQIPVEHEVKLADFTKWLERKGGSPREVIDRKRIRDILELPNERS
jgi:predicted ThiF/HesA family dinucleotide-utilizing enzyme